MPRDEVVGPPHAGVGRERDAANGGEQGTPEAPPEQEPRVVGEERRGECGEEHELGPQRARCGERPRNDKDWRGGQGKPTLFEEH
jgi:hypothetical protein